MSGIVGSIGTFTAGRLADHLAQRDPRWLAWVVALGKEAWCLSSLAFLADGSPRR